MRASRPAVRCLQCLGRTATRRARPFSASARASASDPAPEPAPRPRPPAAPKPVIDTAHIRAHVELYEQNCRERNYAAAAPYPRRIAALHAERRAASHAARRLRERQNDLGRRLAAAASPDGALLAEARALKAELAALDAAEARAAAEMDALAAALPNLSSPATPRGPEPRLLRYINGPPPTDAAGPSHVDIGAELGLLDLAAGAGASGWGWYYLVGDGARLEQALVQYALAAAARAGWTPVSPPSVVYSHVASACGFQPRDQHGETQIYTLAQPADSGKPERCLAATAEIPLAGMKAGATLDASALPLRLTAASRCFRAEAGARGAETRGLYRVHEFTKVELFAWAAADAGAADALLDEVVGLQEVILGALGLRCRVLEMPAADLGASAARKVDVEAFFPGRGRAGAWGEVTSASVCGDYQTRRLGTRLRAAAGRLAFPWTVNGTALAVPRVLAALLENGWDEADRSVAIPEVLRPWMDGQEKIRGKGR